MTGVRLAKRLLGHAETCAKYWDNCKECPDRDGCPTKKDMEINIPMKIGGEVFEDASFSFHVESAEKDDGALSVRLLTKHGVGYMVIDPKGMETMLKAWRKRKR